jgi:fibronectin type 3 domain-containing protein
MSQKVYGKRIYDGIREKIQTFKANPKLDEKSIELYWNYPLEGVKQFNIYRAQGSQKVTLYEMLKIENVKMFYDKKIQIGTKYKYAIQALFKDGTMSEMSDIKEVSYE